MNNIEVISKYLLVFKIVIPKMNIIVIIIYYLLLYIFIKTYNKKYLLIMLLILCVYKYSYLIDNNYYVYYLDVSQGDSSIIRYKDKVYMIDTGGKVNSNYLYTDNTIKMLKSFGYSSADYLILTHGDYDHIGEAINLVNNYKVENVIFNCGSYNDLEKELIKVLDKKKIKYYSCIKELNIDKNKLYFLQTKEYDNENDNSNVIYTELDGYKFMLMGDAGVTTEKEIINKYNLSDIDVLKVGHHGSKTSSSEEFINEIKPKYSIISVGKNNRYGHPNKGVLENLRDSKIYRTDQDGSILFKIKNNKLKIETCSP
jgi:competence protein ComEC